MNSFPQMGLLFSDGAGGGDAPTGFGACAFIVVVGDWAVDGAFEPSPLQLAIDAANPARTATPATTRARRTGSKFSIMTSPIDRLDS